LIAVDSPSFQTQWESVLSLSTLGVGVRPSDLYRNVTSWMPAACRESPLARWTFLSKMPSDMKKLLLSREELTLRELAVYADTIADSVGTSPPHLVSTVETNMAEISAERARKTPPPRKSSRWGLCFYHHRWADKARRCEPGCSWRTGTASGNAAGAGQ